MSFAPGLTIEQLDGELNEERQRRSNGNRDSNNLASTHWIERAQFSAMSAPQSVPMPPFENAGGGYSFALLKAEYDLK
jgi:hypothetical protein